ncbi:Arc family DNA-binding protein [Delftia sp. WSY_4]|uniref:Arc family DNA-binding protein n=1 Tax=unclassified Delftia TaxID=2613839 RepID=UPI00370B983C
MNRTEDATLTMQCKLRLPVDMHARLNKLAGAANRSLNAEIVHRLAQTLGEDFAAEQPEVQPVLAEMAGYLRELRDMARAQAEQSRQRGLTALD